MASNRDDKDTAPAGADWRSGVLGRLDNALLSSGLAPPAATRDPASLRNAARFLKSTATRVDADAAVNLLAVAQDLEREADRRESRLVYNSG